jgi:superfamily II DNA/RNA helicase
MTFNHKERMLEHLLTNEDVQQMIIFTATKAEADFLADDLCEKGFSASALHGDMKQSMRNRTLQGLRRGEIKILVATDVAARGIDVPIFRTLLTTACLNMAKIIFTVLAVQVVLVVRVLPLT